MPEYLLGIDVGTTGTKGILLHPARGIVAETTVPAALHAPRPGWAEGDPAEWWDNVGQVARACMQQASVQPREVAGVGVSGMVPTLILLDKDGEVLYRSIQQNDARAHLEIREQQARTDAKEVLQRTGSAITQQSIGPKLLWLQRHHPALMARAARVLGSYDYVVYRMTGAFSCERNWALESGLFDLHAQEWDAELLALAGARREWLGKVRWPSEVVGTISTEAATSMGLAAGTPVVAGSADHVASAYSAGLESPGDLLVKLGGAGDILYSLDRPVIDERLYLDYHVIPGKFLLNGCMAASGSIIKWFQQEFAPALDYQSLDAEASRLPPGSDKLVLLPYFLGEKTPLNDPLARGVLFGLTLSHTRAHAYRAILEGIAYGFRHHLDVLDERGLAAAKARVTNGGARSTFWKQVTADVLGIPLEQVAEHPGSSLGAAVVAGVGVGIFQDWGAIGQFVRIAAVTEPDKDANRVYGELYGVYRQLYRSLQRQYQVLHEI